MKYFALFATLVITAGLVACKKAAAPASTTPPPVVAITIFPTATQTVVVGSANNTTISFSDTVTNTTNTAVTWEVNGTAGGSITTGTISTTGLYTAPTSLINPINVTVTVVSVADTTKLASTTVDVTLPPPVAISPTSITLAAGATKQFMATTTPANLPVAWYVNCAPGGNGTCVPGGNSLVGTITQSGLYTAPQVPYPGGPVSVNAVLQPDNTKFAVATAVLTYSNFSLQGSYAFLLRGSDPSGLLLRAGSMTADNHGNVTGIEDINNGINLVQPGVSFTGTYTIHGDGRGTVTFNDGFNGNTAGAGNASTFSVVIVSTGQVQMEELDAFAAASGEADLQDATSFQTSKFNGEYTFDFSGVDAASKPISSVGELFADGVGGGTARPAQEDVNDNGTLTSIPSTPIFSFQSVGANSRGVATLNGASYSFYMISASRVQFIATGNPAAAVTAGVATLQTGAPFDVTSLGGNSLLITNGSSTLGPISTAASFFLPSANQITAGVLNQNNSGSVTVANFSGTYTVAASGRGTATLSTGQTYVFYLIAVNQAVIQETDHSIVADGTLIGLAGGPFSTSNLANGYALQLTGVKAASSGEQDTLGQINLTNGQVATGTVDVNTATNAGLTAFTSASGVAIPAGTAYMIANGQGPFNVTVAGTNLTFVAYFLSSSSLYLLRTDMTDTRVLHGNLFQDVSLSPAIASPNSATFTVGLQGNFTVVATGNPGATLSETGALPSGVTFNTLTSVLSGTPATGTGGTVSTAYPIQFTATNGVGSNAVQNFTLTVLAPATN
jgi:hypothetical protein